MKKNVCLASGGNSADEIVAVRIEAIRTGVLTASKNAGSADLTNSKQYIHKNLL